LNALDFGWRGKENEAYSDSIILLQITEMRSAEDINGRKRFSVGGNAEFPINTNSIGSQKGKMLERIGNWYRLPLAHRRIEKKTMRRGFYANRSTSSRSQQTLAPQLAISIRCRTTDRSGHATVQRRISKRLL
jgi:hypothetical protein